MPDYLVEVYQNGIHLADLPHVARRAREAAEHVTGVGSPVRYVGSIAIPNDEMCFHLYAGSAAAVTEATRRAALSVDRIVEAARVGWGPGGEPTRRKGEMSTARRRADRNRAHETHAGSQEAGSATGGTRCDELR